MKIRHLSLILSAFCTPGWLWADAGKKDSGKKPEVAALSRDQCRVEFQRIADTVFAHNRGLLRDAEKGTQDPYWGRLSRALHATSEGTLRDLFTGPNRITAQKIEEIWWAIRIGDLRVDLETDRFFQGLRDFARDHPQLFDGKPDFPYRLRQALQAVDARHGFEGSPEAAAHLTARALSDAEETLLAQAIREGRGIRNASSRRFDWFWDFWSPHHSRMAGLIEFNQALRMRMQHMFIADEPIDHALKLYGAGLTASERERLQALVTDTSGQLQDVRDIFRRVYGIELSSTRPVKIGDIRLRTLHARASDINAQGKFDDAVERSEKDLDVHDAVLRESRERQKLGERPLAEYHDRHLQIRNPQYYRETGSLQSRYYSHSGATVKDSDYQVEASWTVTVKHEETRTREVERRYQKDDGTWDTEVVEEEYTHRYETKYTMRERFTLDADYNEVLGGRIRPSSGRVDYMLPDAEVRGHNAVSASNGPASIEWVDTVRTQQILDWGKKAREIEKPLRDKIDELITLTNSIRKDYPGNIAAEKDWTARLAELEKAKAELERLQKERLGEYHKWEKERINGQWKQDDPKHFAERNRQLNNRYLHLMHRIDLFREQVRRRAPSLEVTYTVPDRSPQLSVLDEIRHRVRVQQGIGAMAVIGTGTAAGIYLSDPERRQGVEDVYSRIKKKILGD